MSTVPNYERFMYVSFSQQARSLEVYKFLGLLADIKKLARDLEPLRIYAPPDGVKPIKTWNLFEHEEPTPSCPIVSIVSIVLDAARPTLAHRQTGCYSDRAILNA
jgi:hypothetical protein